MTAARLVEQHETWLALRLVRVADTLLEDSTELAARTGFADAWAAFEAWPAGAVGRAARQPLLARWVGTAERLVAAGVPRRYPAAHPSRHLQDFARLLLSWAADAPDGSAGRVPLLGRRCFPLLHGRLLLLTDRPQVDGALHWVRSGRTLEVGLGRTIPVAEVDLAEPDRAVVGPGWSVVVTPSVDGLLVDPWTPEYGGRGSSPDVRAVLEGLPGPAARLVATVGRCLVVRPAGLAWTAGLLDVAGPVVEADQVVHAAYRDLWLRWTTLTAPSLAGALPASPLSDLRTSLAEQGADRYLRDLHADHDPGTGPQDLWPVPAAVADAEPDRRLLLVSPAAAGVDLTQEPGLTKTRRASHGDLDWSAVNALSSLPHASLRRYLQHALAAAPTDEGAAYSGAAAAYVLADWSTCLSLLERCLRADADVEEYRYLRAFALRHAGDAGAFDRAVFGDPGAPAELVRA